MEHKERLEAIDRAARLVQQGIIKRHEVQRYLDDLNREDDEFRAKILREHIDSEYHQRIPCCRCGIDDYIPLDDYVCRRCRKVMDDFAGSLGDDNRPA